MELCNLTIYLLIFKTVINETNTFITSRTCKPCSSSSLNSIRGVYWLNENCSFADILFVTDLGIELYKFDLNQMRLRTAKHLKLSIMTHSFSVGLETSFLVLILINILIWT